MGLDEGTGRGDHDPLLFCSSKANLGAMITSRCFSKTKYHSHDRMTHYFSKMKAKRRASMTDLRATATTHCFAKARSRKRQITHYFSNTKAKRWASVTDLGAMTTMSPVLIAVKVRKVCSYRKPRAVPMATCMLHVMMRSSKKSTHLHTHGSSAVYQDKRSGFHTWCCVPAWPCCW